MAINRFSSIGRTSRTLLVLAFSVTGAAAASAQGTPEQRAACTPDALRLCSAEIPDIGRVTACMRAKQASLSPRCRAAFLSASTRHSYAENSPRHRYRHTRHNVVAAYRSHDGYGVHHRFSRYRYRQLIAMAMQVMEGLRESGMLNGMDGYGYGYGGDYDGGYMNDGMGPSFGGGFGGDYGYMNPAMIQAFMNSGMGQEIMNSGMAESFMQSYMR